MDPQQLSAMTVWTMWLELKFKLANSGQQQFSSSGLCWRLFARDVKGNQMFPTSPCPLKPSLVTPPSQFFTQPPTPQSSKEVCWWMLKAAPVPQQLTLLLQEAACQVDGISPLLLPVTQSRGGCRQMLLLCVCFTVWPAVESLHKPRATRCIASH